MLDKRNSGPEAVVSLMAEIGRKARAAAHPLSIAAPERKRAALVQWLKRSSEMKASSLKPMRSIWPTVSNGALGLLHRPPEALAGPHSRDGRWRSDYADLADPIGDVMAAWDRPNGLHIERVRTPLGVIGVIRKPSQRDRRRRRAVPEGRQCRHSARGLGLDQFGPRDPRLPRRGPREGGLPAEAIQLVPVSDRAAVGEMLKGLGGNIDVIVPAADAVWSSAFRPMRAFLSSPTSKASATSTSTAPRCSTWPCASRSTPRCGGRASAVPPRRPRGPGCGPHASGAAPRRVAERRLRDSRDAEVFAAYAASIPADESDWSTEYLDAIISVALVDGVDGAIAHIERYSSHHTRPSSPKIRQRVQRFFTEIDSAILLHNASTQFADGGEFGMGAEIGIATGQDARAGSGRGRTAHIVQVSRARQRPGPGLSCCPLLTLTRSTRVISGCSMPARAWRSGCSGGPSIRRMPGTHWSPKRRCGVCVSIGSGGSSPGQSAQGPYRSRAARRPHRPLRGDRSGIAGGCDRLRGFRRHALHGRYARAREGAQSGNPLRLDHGRRQPRRLSSLAALARDRRDFSDCRRRPPRVDTVAAVLAHGEDV